MWLLLVVFFFFFFFFLQAWVNIAKLCHWLLVRMSSIAKLCYRVVVGGHGMVLLNYVTRCWLVGMG